MKTLSGLVLCLAAVALAGCGDNSNECGDGTHVEDGYCVPDDTNAPPNCGDGTMLDDASNTCVIDPDACQAGTVLIAGECVDPTAGLTVDVTEGAEPNALGFFGEDSNEPAGIFEIKPIGGVTVIKGNVNGHPDADEDGKREIDSDVYLFEVAAPTLLEISVDGVAGLAGSFVLLPDPSDPDLGDWLRGGLNLTGDTAKRQVFLPKGGVYELVITDSRSLFGNEDGLGDENTNYFVSVVQKAVPDATLLTLTNNTATSNGTITSGDVQFFSAQLDLGLSDIEVQSFDSDFQAGLTVVTGTTFKGESIEQHSTFGDFPATVRAGGFTAGQRALFAVDELINTGNTNVDFFVRVTTSAGGQIPEDAGTITLDNGTQTNTTSDALKRSFFFFDATVANEIIGLDLTFNLPVSGSIINSRGTTVAPFTSFAVNRTFTAYKGLVRVPAAGRYYVAVYAPASAVGTDITITGQVERAGTEPLTFGAPATDVMAGSLNAKAFSYVVNAEDWQLFTASADAASNGATVRVGNPASMYGALNPLATNTSPVAPSFTPLFELSPGSNATESQGVLVPGAPATLLAVVSTTSGSGTYDLSVAARTYTDLGQQAAPFDDTRATETFTGTAANRYYLRTDPGNTVTITVDPAVTRAAGITQLDAFEGTIDSVDGILVNVTTSLEIDVDNRGYVAFEVNPGLGTGGYSLRVEIEEPPPPPATDYVSAAGSTPWMNICNLPSARDITPSNRDDAYTATFNLPGGFTFYGAAVTSAKASTNGFLTFTTATTTNTVTGDLIPTPDLPDATIAPYWADWVNVRVCVLEVGNELTVQWTGEAFFYGNRWGTQVHLSTVDDSIELVYAPYFENDGDGAAGIQEDDGNGQTEIEYTFDDVAGTSILLTPAP